ncbi:MAG: N-glycosylase/DNA lyase [Aquificae bacterium]|nr:N-glycosylase/DNA lyase [Aquificota bacterium]
MDLGSLEEVLSSFSPEEVERIERLDPQYRALERLFSSLGDEELFFKLVLVNALLSYRLPTKGERYWNNFANFFSRRPDLSAFEEFLRLYNNRLLEGKLKRLRRALRAVEKLSAAEFARFCRNPEGLLNFLVKEMNQPPTAKTLVFAVKMFLYACRVAGKAAARAPFSLAVPLDSRLRKVSEDLGFWNDLSRRVGIAPLHLDALVWLSLGGDAEFLSSLEGELKEKVLRLRSVLKKLTGERG